MLERIVRDACSISGLELKTAAENQLQLHQDLADLKEDNQQDALQQGVLLRNFNFSRKINRFINEITSIKNNLLPGEIRKEKIKEKELEIGRKLSPAEEKKLVVNIAADDYIPFLVETLPFDLKLLNDALKRITPLREMLEKINNEVTGRPNLTDILAQKKIGDKLYALNLLESAIIHKIDNFENLVEKKAAEVAKQLDQAFQKYEDRQIDQIAKLALHDEVDVNYLTPVEKRKMVKNFVERTEKKVDDVQGEQKGKVFDAQVKMLDRELSVVVSKYRATQEVRSTLAPEAKGNFQQKLRNFQTTLNQKDPILRQNNDWEYVALFKMVIRALSFGYLFRSTGAKVVDKAYSTYNNQTTFFKSEQKSQVNNQREEKRAPTVRRGSSGSLT